MLYAASSFYFTVRKMNVCSWIIVRNSIIPLGRTLVAVRAV